MPKTSRIRVLYLSYFSRPASDRLVYREILRRRAQNILELGVGVGCRAARMIETARAFAAPGAVRYTGIDPFEARSSADGPGVTLKLAHRLLKSTGARVQLLPGGPWEVLARRANALGKVDLIVVSSRLDPAELARAWFYVPRLLHAETVVLAETAIPGGGTAIRRIESAEIAALASRVTGRRAA